MTVQEIKLELYKKCFSFIEKRFQSIQNSIAQIQESLASETKNTAGDKHETGRAMLQLEREKLGIQLAEIQKIRNSLSGIDISTTLKVVGLGSLVYTSNANYFIAISAGEIKIGNDLFYAISPETPIAKLILRKNTGDMFEFRDKAYCIYKIN